MLEAHIIAAVRTPGGRRTGADPAREGDAILGRVGQAGVPRSGIADIIIVGEFARTSTGKIQRFAVRDAIVAGLDRQ